MAYPPCDEDLGHEETQALEKESIIISSAPQRGRRKVSGALLSPPETENSSSSSLASSTVAVRYKSFKASINSTLDLPMFVISSASLEFIGFTSDAAMEIYTRWISRPDPANNPDDLIDYVYGQTSRLKQEPYRDYPPNEAMTRIGLASWLQDAITDPRHSAVYRTQTLHFWVNDTLRINYLTLQLLQSRLKYYAIQSMAKRERPKRGKLEGAIEPAAATSSEPAVASLSDTNVPHPRTATLNMKSKAYNLPKIWVAVQSSGPVLAEHVVLYKAKAAAEMGEPQWIEDDGCINMGAMATYPGGDFNHRGSAWYWTPEPETAEQYRAYAERRCPWSDTWLIRIQVPRSFIDGLRLEELWYSYNWKEYIWHCRNQMQPPPQYDTYWKSGGADIVKGHILSSASSQVTRIKKEQVQSSITEAFVTMNSSRKAIQWAFMQAESAERLGREIRGKIHIDITAAREGQEK